MANNWRPETQIPLSLEIMAFFGKRLRPQGFHYNPMYYDAAKEEREARIKAAQAAADGDPEAIKARISASFKNPRRSKSEAYQSARRRSNITVVISLIALLALAYILLTKFLPQIEQMVE